MTSEAAANVMIEEREDAPSAMSSVARAAGRTLVYAALLIWTFIALFPLYWTFSTSFKLGRDVTQGHLIPWVDFSPGWKGWQSLGLSPDTIFATSNVRDEFLKKFFNSVICSVGASAVAIVIGSLAAYGLSRFDYKFGRWRNQDLSFFFLSQLILPPVVLALPFLVLYKELALLDTRVGLVLVYTLMVLPIVIWVMRDQFDTIPPELEQAALVDGCSIWGAFFRIVLPIALPGMVAAFILSLVLCWNEYFFASLLTGFDAQTLPVMVASQTGSQGINWWTMAALSAAAITPLLLIGIFLERYIVMGLTAGSGKSFPPRPVQERADVTTNYIRVFGQVKPVIAMVHLGASPGAPLFDPHAGVEGIVECARKDLKALQAAGFDAVMFGNENDRPYELKADVASSATMAYVVGRLRAELALPFGVNVLWDPISTLRGRRRDRRVFRARDIYRRLRFGHGLLDARRRRGASLSQAARSRRPCAPLQCFGGIRLFSRPPQRRRPGRAAPSSHRFPTRSSSLARLPEKRRERRISKRPSACCLERRCSPTPGSSMRQFATSSRSPTAASSGPL